MKLRLSLLALAASLALPAAAQAWTRTWVVEWNEPAMYYGAKEGVIDPGTDCPQGTNAEPDWVQEMVKAGYTLEEAKWLRDPANPTRNPVNGQNGMAFRGKDWTNVYVNPTSTPESGKFVTVSGKLGEGIDLDGNKKNGFTGLNGEKGIDNEFYRAMGCWKTYRGPQRLSSGALSMNDSMREGSWTTVIVASGAGKDPLNDKNVQVGIYLAKDKMIKDGNGGIARDYTFRIKPDAKLEALFKAKTSKGVILSTEPAEEVWIRDPGYTRELQLLKAKLALTMKDDGSLVGYVGGYRPWQPVYQGWVNGRGPVIEALTWVRLPDVYYALRRHADYSPTGKGGEKTHISFALRVEALPAFVMTPEGDAEVSSVISYKDKAPKDQPRLPPGIGIAIVDGLVVDRKNPDAIKPPKPGTILPKPTASAATPEKKS